MDHQLSSSSLLFVFIIFFIFESCFKSEFKFRFDQKILETKNRLEMFLNNLILVNVRKFSTFKRFFLKFKCVFNCS